MESAQSGSEKPQMKRRLGRGLNALLGGGADEAEESPGVIPMVRPTAKPEESAPIAASPGSDEISVELIEANPFQPRRDFDEAQIEELAASLRKHGILQPLLVRPNPDDEAGYQLIAGERRLRAARRVGLETVPCRVIEVEDQQVCEAALEENLKRQDLNVLEKAVAFREYLDRFGGSIEDLARQLSCSRSAVSNILRLLELPETVQVLVREDKLSAGHARALLPLDEAGQLEAARQIESEQLSVRKTEQMVRALLKASTEEAPAAETDTAAAGATSKPELTPHVLALQDQLREQLSAKVDIRLRTQEAGQVVIHFGDTKDFERLIGKLRKAA